MIRHTQRSVHPTCAGLPIGVGLLIATLAACGGGASGSGSGAGSGDDGGRTTTTAALAPTTTTTTVAGFATPDEAIADYVHAQGNEYVGDCAGADLETDVGRWCSALGADGGATRTYGIGPVFAEFVEELTLELGPGGWTVTGSEPVPPPDF